VENGCDDKKAKSLTAMDFHRNVEEWFETSIKVG
jgi:hypothetical protein